MFRKADFNFAYFLNIFYLACYKESLYKVVIFNVTKVFQGSAKGF